MGPIIVLVTKGKRESVDYATVKLFFDKDEAENFITTTNDLDKKYWTKAEIVYDGEEIELESGYQT